ncbi:MAG: polysaccharide pyruvyl transferase family protein [Gordonia sp. (in: high G+C Gram-positive bacteria)]|uniref:polysaccharide pyruvyl transferase family protein n=1 Tax=Gordonia sp. (in: high G+C Gram-positive bacteria) TaxID=84139 RepID=UPI003BB6CC65
MNTVSSLRRKAKRAFEFHDLIYLVGPAGYPNYGDEVITEAWLRYLARHRPLATVVVDCGRPGSANLLLRQVNPRAIFVNTLWELMTYAESSPDNRNVDPKRPWEWVAQAASRFGVAPAEGSGVEMLLRAKTIHLVGGGYVNRVWPQHIALIAAIAEVSRVTGARAVATGQGLLPALQGAALDRLRTDIAQFDVFDVRDGPSHDLLEGLGATWHGDDAWLSPHVRRPTARMSTGEVVICAQSDLTDDFRRGANATGPRALASLLTEILDAWQVPGERVRIIEAIPGQDMAVPLLMGDRLDGAVRTPFLDVWRDGLPSGRGYTWLCTRFHPHLLAATAGDSGVAIVPRPDYYGVKHSSLTDLGSRWTVVSGDDPVPTWPHPGGYLPEEVEAAVANKAALAKALYPAGVRVR